MGLDSICQHGLQIPQAGWMVTQQVQSTPQGNPEPKTCTTSILLAYCLQQRCKTKAQENPLSLDNNILLL